MTFKEAVEKMKATFPGETCAIQFQYWACPNENDDYVTIGLSVVGGPCAYGGHRTFEEAFTELEQCLKPKDLLSQAPQGEGGGTR